MTAAQSGSAPPPPSPQPVTGHAWDTILSDAAGVGGRIMNAFGEGGLNDWGASPLGLDPVTEGILRKNDLYRQYEDSHNAFIKGVNEAVIRPTVQMLDAPARLATAPGPLLGSIGAGLSQAGQEIAPGQEPGRPTNLAGAIATPFAAGGELATGASEGLIGPEFALHIPGAEAAAGVTAEARASGVIGEGEAGFYGAAPVTPGEHAGAHRSRS